MSSLWFRCFFVVVDGPFIPRCERSRSGTLQLVTLSYQAPAE